VSAPAPLVSYHFKSAAANSLPVPNQLNLFLFVIWPQARAKQYKCVAAGVHVTAEHFTGNLPCNSHVVRSCFMACLMLRAKTVCRLNKERNFAGPKSAVTNSG
jgi:hypothetical protein